jgi:xanthine/uracil permease
MIGAVVFVMSFVLFTGVSLAVGLPPGIWVHDWFNIPETEYAFLINGIVNGVVYGVIIWVAFSLTKMAWERKKKKIIKGD